MNIIITQKRTIFLLINACLPLGIGESTVRSREVTEALEFTIKRKAGNNNNYCSIKVVRHNFVKLAIHTWRRKVCSCYI